MDIFQILFYQPTFNLMVWFKDIFGDIGWAIIGIALLSKLLTIPLTRSQIKNAEKSSKLQVKMKELRKKYKHNEQKLAEEMAKLQASALPGQLGGCLSIIIFIVLFIQIRAVILDLVNRGFYAYNQVAYAESLQKKEDYIRLDLPEGFTYGSHTLQLNVATDNGTMLTKTYQFDVAEDKEQRIEAIKEEYYNMSQAERDKRRQELTALHDQERAQDFGVYNKDLEASLVSVPLSQFLFFTTDAVQAHILTDNTPDLTFYLRAPSNHTLDYSQMRVVLDGQEITESASFQQGEKINLNFAGINLSRVATDFGLFNLAVTLPYILLSLLSGVSQYFVTKLYSANAEVAATVETKPEDHDGKPNIAKDPKEKKKGEEDEPDFAEMMASSTKQMNFIFPAMTVAMSLGYLGGASFIPMGVTLFWTAQNSFVIIQQMISQRQRLLKQVRSGWNGLQKRFLQKPA